MKLTTQEIVALLSATKSGAGYMACCPAHDDKNPSLSINEGADGMVLVHCHAGCAQDQVVEAIRRLGPTPLARSVATRDDKTVEKILQGCVSLESPQAISAVRYLLNRKLDPSVTSGCLQAHPNLEYFDEAGGKSVYPALVALIKDKTSRVIGVQRIYLTAEGAKAPVRSPKKICGKFKGGSVTFGEPSKTVHVAEGVETALCVFNIVQEYTLSLISVAGLEAFQPCKDIEVVHIWADLDKSQTGQIAGTNLAKRLVRSGFKVFVHLPKGDLENRKSLDWLDVLCEQGAELIQSELNSNKHFDDFDLAALPRPISLRDLNALPKESLCYLIDQLLITSGCSLLIAKPKVGKSTLARQAAAAVASGSQFLGRATTKGKVIYIALEEKQSEILRHFSEINPDLQDEIFVHCEKAPGSVFEWLELILSEFKPDLVIIDPLFRFLRSKDANDYSELSNTLESLMTLARKSKAHIMCVHHARKGDGSSGDSVLGSTAILGAVDMSIYMRISDKRRTIQSDHRYGTPIEESVLNFNPENRTMEIIGTKEAVGVKQVAESIVEFLKNQSSFLLEKSIEENIETKTKSFREALRNLVGEGRVTRVGEGKKGKPYFYCHSDNACSLVPPICAEQGKLFSELS